MCQILQKKRIHTRTFMHLENRKKRNITYVYTSETHYMTMSDILLQCLILVPNNLYLKFNLLIKYPHCLNFNLAHCLAIV